MAVLREWRAEIRRALRDEYVRYVTATGLAEYAATPGNLGSGIAVRDLDAERSEVVTLSWWTDRDAIVAFAGPDIGKARYFPRRRPVPADPARARVSLRDECTGNPLRLRLTVASSRDDAHRFSTTSRRPPAARRRPDRRNLGRHRARLGASAARQQALWTPDQKIIGFRNISRLYGGDVAHHGTTVMPLPRAAHPLDLHYQAGGAAWDAAKFMEHSRVAGLIVLHRGQIVLERYALDQTEARPVGVVLGGKVRDIDSARRRHPRRRHRRPR